MTVLDLSAYKPVPATLGDANQIANGMQAIQACINALDNNNFAAGKIFDPLKLMQDGASAGQALVWSAAANGGTGGWVPGNAAPLAVIMDYTVTGAPVASVDTNTILGGNIPQTYANLRMYLKIRGTAAITQGTWSMRVNNDSGANYDQILNYFNNVFNQTSAGGATLWDPSLGTAESASGPAGSFSAYNLHLMAYRDAQHKHMTSFGASEGAAAASFFTIVGLHRWLSTAAVTRLAFTCSSLTTFDIGSRFIIIGEG